MTQPSKRCTKCGVEYPATRKYFTAHKSSRFGLTSECKSCRNERDRQSRAAHPEKRREQARQSYAAHPEKKCEQQRQYQAAYPEKERERARKRRARKRGAEGTHTAEDVAAQYQRQRGKCYYCGCKLTKKPRCRNSATVEHVVPLVRGGRNSPDNLVIACLVCNLSKQDKLPHEWTQGGRLL